MDTFVGRNGWPSRSLCKRYAVVVFSATSRIPITGAVAPNQKIGWALGTLINGDRELLGAWYLNGDGVIPAEVFGHLYDRGVESITYAAGELAASKVGLLATYSRAVLLPSIEQSFAAALGTVSTSRRAAALALLRAATADVAQPPPDAISGISRFDGCERYRGILEHWAEAVAVFEPLFALPEPYRQLVRSVDRTAAEVQERLMRAIHRHGPFIDASEAFEFVAAALQRADLQFERERRAKRLARDTGASASDRWGAASGRALATPALG